MLTLSRLRRSTRTGAILWFQGGQYGSSYRAQVSDRLLEESADQNVRIMDAVGTDLQLLSPRPFPDLEWNCPVE